MCEHCSELSNLGRLTPYGGIGNVDFRDLLKVRVESNKEVRLKEAAPLYVAEHYPDINKAYSLPENFILLEKKFKELLNKEEEKLKNINELECEKSETSESEGLPADELSVEMVFKNLKYAFKDVPSLTLADYSFQDTLHRGINTDALLKGIDQQQIDEFKEGLKQGDHDTASFGLFGRKIIGIFIQIKGTTPTSQPITKVNSLKKAILQVRKDIQFFRTVCSTIIGSEKSSNVRLAGFTAFPMLSNSDLRKLQELKELGKKRSWHKFVPCSDCIARILTKSDLSSVDRFKLFLRRQGIELKKCNPQDSGSHVRATFKDIFDLYVSGASTVDFPRSPIELVNKSDEQMKRFTAILTPQQYELVRSKADVIFLTGTSGTGKTFVIKKKALDLAKDVLVINMAGGDLTEEFRSFFRGETILHSF